jgi:hypothetical protein
LSLKNAISPQQFYYVSPFFQDEDLGSFSVKMTENLVQLQSLKSGGHVL